MSNRAISLGVIGVGKVVRDQHLPSIAKNSGFRLVAMASRNASVESVSAFRDIASMLDSARLDPVALCLPPQYRQAAAQLALQRGKHVLLEKPPCAIVLLDGQEIDAPPSSEHAEYETIYANFSDIIERGVSEVDLSPLKLVADAFLLADREQVVAFRE